MRTTSLLAFVAVLAPLAWAQLCPNNAVSSADNSKCFQFLALKSNFLAAEQTCRALGGHLASVYNAADVDIVNRGAQQFFKGPGRELYWVGGTNMNTNFEIWQWTDGEPFRYRNWAKPEDNNPLLFNKNCVAVERSNGTWVPDQCCLLKPFVCEAPVIVPPTCPPVTCPPITPCPECPTQTPCPTSPPITTTPKPTCDASWNFLPETGKCYRSYSLSTSITWEDAEAACVRENGHLASIHSKVENDFVGRLVGSGSFYDDPWIGASSPGKNNIFVWTDGTPWDYTNWYINEPNQIGWENCVEIYLNDGDNYRWNNVPCETPRFHVYVCKKSSN